MSAIRQTPTKSLMLFSGRAYPELADEIGGHLGIAPTPTSSYEFANGELYVRFEESVRGCDAFILQSHTSPINTWLMESLLMVDAAKRASAKRITVVAPFFPYARQDKKHRGREPISARLVADLFKTAGADRLMSVDLHTAQVQGFFDGPVDHLFAMDLLINEVKRKWGDRDLTVVSPDSGRVRVSERWSDKLGGTPLAFIHKTRDMTRPNEVVANRVVGDVARPGLHPGRRHDRHRRHDREGRRDAVLRGRRRRHHRRHPRRALRARRRPAEEQPGRRGADHQHAARSRPSGSSTSSPCSPSPRCWPGPSRRSSRTAA